MQIIQRKFYLEKIKPFIGKKLIKVIIGQRRVGKSFLLLQIMEEVKNLFPKSINIFIDKERYEFDKIKNYSDLLEYLLPQIKEGIRTNIFLDEIQEIAEFERGLRHLQSLENIDIYCTGSNANLLSGELATFLSGRYIEIKVFSLTWKEFLKFHQLPDNNETLNKYINFGGLPYLINLPLEEKIISEYLKGIFNTVVYKDVISRFNVRNTLFLDNLVKFTANNVGSILSAKRISDFLKSQKINMSPQIVLTYLDYLQQAFLIYKVRRADITGKKIFEIGEKYYFEDWGIKNALVGYRKQYINQILENIIFLHLKANGYIVFVGTTNNKEIDFICERDGEKFYIQIAYLIPDEKVIKREFDSLLAINDNYRKFVVSLDEFPVGNYKGIEHLHLREFLNGFE